VIQWTGPKASKDFSATNRTCVCDMWLWRDVMENYLVSWTTVGLSSCIAL